MPTTKDKMNNNTFIVCYVIKKSNIGTPYPSPTYEDYYKVFLEHDEMENSPEEQARQFFNNLKSGAMDEDDVELYSANICQVIDSTEAHYLNIDNETVQTN